MSYPYTNEEISSIAKEVTDLWFKWITESSDSHFQNLLINGYSDPNKMWEPFCMYAEKYCSLTTENGMRKEMLSREQIAIVVSTVRRKMIQASRQITNAKG